MKYKVEGSDKGSIRGSPELALGGMSRRSKSEGRIIGLEVETCRKYKTAVVRNAIRI